jgi:hypothetical protein
MRTKPLIFLFAFFCSKLLAQLAPPPATVDEVIAGTDTYKYVSPYSLAQAGIGASGGGIVFSNAWNLSLAADTWYTNNTEYAVQVEATAILQGNTTAGAKSAAFLFQVITNVTTGGGAVGNLTYGKTWTAAPSMVETYNDAIGGFVPTNGAFRYLAQVTGSGATASIAANTARLTYFAAGGGSGTIADGSLTTNKVDATFLQAMLSQLPVYNVDLYGADHDPAGTNDHFAIQRAIDAATNTGGGIIYFPGGDYWVTNFSFHPTFRSENMRSAITLHSNCSWVLQGGNNASIKLQDTTGDPTDFVIIGSGNVNAGVHFIWKAADHIVLRNLTFDMQNTPALYDMTEIHDGKYFIADGCRFINQTLQTADAIDATGSELVLAQNCVFSNWNGSLFTGVNNGSGLSIFRNNYVTNCNVDFSLNHGFDIGAGTAELIIENSYFGNVGKVLKSESGRRVLIKDSVFEFMSHASVPATNLQFQGETEIKGCRFSGRVTANTIGCIVLDGPQSTGRIINNYFINCRAVWTTNTLDFEFSGNRVVGGFSPLILGGTGRTPYLVRDNTFGTDPANQYHVFDNGLSLTHNLDFTGNNCLGFLVKAYGTNWTFKNNIINSTTTGYIDDNGNANTRFIGNVTIPFGNAANELRMSGASNYVSGNVVNDVAVYSGAYGSYFCDNIIESGNIAYYSGNEASFRNANAVIQNNYNRVGVPLPINSPTHLESVYMTTNLATTTLDFTKSFSTHVMTANITLAAPSGVSVYGKHAQTHTCIFTNNSAGEKTISVPASWFNMSTATATIYNTNKGVLTVTIYPGAGTNYTWEGR